MNNLQAQRIAHTTVPRSGQLADLVDVVSAKVGRPIAVLGKNLSPMHSGVWYSNDINDEIHFPSNVPLIAREAAVCHELAHILLGHEPHSVIQTGGELFKHIDPGAVQALRVMHRSVYDEPPEHDAEILATMLLHRLRAKRATRSHSPLH
ncbi:MAG: hypothetical protein M3Y49_15565 [Actinomycetota bacterium]|nr:hypothetical protein [Actinomycetota bacterium]